MLTVTPTRKWGAEIYTRGGPARTFRGNCLATHPDAWWRRPHIPTPPPTGGRGESNMVRGESQELKSTNKIFGEVVCEYAIREYTICECATVRYANMRFANMRYASMRVCDMRYTNMRCANMRICEHARCEYAICNMRICVMQICDGRIFDILICDANTRNTT